jgi:hypothetical protein
MGDKMVVIRENRPSFQSPAKLHRQFEQSAMQHPRPLFPAEVMLPQICAGRDKVSPARSKPMLRRMWPRNLVRYHTKKLAILDHHCKPKITQTVMDCGGKGRRHRFPAATRGERISRERFRLSLRPPSSPGNHQSAVAAPLCQRSPRHPGASWTAVAEAA